MYKYSTAQNKNLSTATYLSAKSKAARLTNAIQKAEAAKYLTVTSAATFDVFSVRAKKWESAAAGYFARKFM